MKPSVTSQKKVANAIFRKMKETKSLLNIKVKRETAAGVECVVISGDFIFGRVLSMASKLVLIYQEIYSETNVGWYAEKDIVNNCVNIVIYVRNDEF